ncbi:1471_t:CDS:2 [Entrophospora sp. SA101]|nr:21016_t:CDS:2 [Entrophospora sp. SA101]CAJ0747182.1 1471_t:CDS:2 [Entrophospora sp. SA101]
MPRINITCDQCKKYVGDEQLARLSDAEKDLDFLEQTEVNLGFVNYLKNQNLNLQEIKDKLDELKKEYHQAQN